MYTRFSGVLLIGLTLFFGFSALSGSNHAQAGAMPSPLAQTDPSLCAEVDAIPVAECETLIVLYNETDGDSWTEATNWLTIADGTTPCEWFGVTCADGHVAGLSLSQNGLAGTVPKSLFDLEALQTLNLSSNALDGAIGRKVCLLTDTVTDLNIDYNKLRARGNRAANCLAQLDAGWTDTQTVAPDDPQMTNITETSVTVSWTPIAYQDDDGYYQVGYASAPSGPWNDAGRTDDKSASSLTINGLEPGHTYYVRMRTVTLPHVAHARPLSDEVYPGAVATDSDETVLLILYFAADNDLSVYVDPLLERLRRGTEANPNAVVVALVDRAGPENTQVWRIAGGAKESDTDFLSQLGVTELDTASSANLTTFLEYARSSETADRTLVSMLGHGVGLTPELAWIPPATATEPNPEPQSGIPPLPRTKFNTPTDVTSGSFMSTPELGRSLLAATGNGADPFDLIFFDQCFAGNLDILYEVRQAADVFIASPNYAWFTAPYHRYLAEFAPTRNAEEMANAVINVYQRSLNDSHPNAIFWLTRDDIESVATAVDGLALALVDAVDAGHTQEIYAAAQASQYVDTTQCGRGNLTLGQPDELLGAGSFSRALQVSFDGMNDAAMESATQGLIDALGNVTGNSRVGNPYLEPGTTWDYTDTLTILAPLPPNSPADRAWRASLYRADLVGEAAIWTPEPSQTVVLSETLAYVADGRWDEFIDAWYRGGLTPTVGEWCSYTPPALVIADDIETLSLTVTGLSTLQLTWSEPLDADAAQYALFAKRPGDISWTLHQLLDGDINELILSGLDAGVYRLMIAAQDESGVYFAKTDSDDVEIVVNVSLFLPIAR